MDDLNRMMGMLQGAPVLLGRNDCIIWSISAQEGSSNVHIPDGGFSRASVQHNSYVLYLEVNLSSKGSIFRVVGIVKCADFLARLGIIDSQHSMCNFCGEVVETSDRKSPTIVL